MDFPKESEQAGNELRMYTNQNAVDVENYLVAKTQKEYYQDRLLAQIESYQRDITEKEELINGYNSKVQVAIEENTTLTNKIPLQSPTDAEVSQKQITTNENKIIGWQTEIEKEQKNIEEIWKQITEAEATLQNFQ